MSIGSSFPPGYRRTQIERQLRPGGVIKLRERMDDGLIHEKRFVVLAVDELTVTCVINSRISAFIEHRPDLRRCQVAMVQADHPFMDHNSFVDCSRTRAYSTADVIRELTDNPTWVLGRVSPDLRDNIVGALKFAPTLAPVDVMRICAEIEATEF